MPYRTESIAASPFKSIRRMEGTEIVVGLKDS